MDASDAVLVALVNRTRDLELARCEHWYRIPAKHAPPHFASASYVAFYLTKAFGQDKWSIREFAPVRGHELVRRVDLLPAEGDHPRAGEAYYKLELGPLIALPRPIVSRTSRRVLFIWTSGDKFSRASEINDLFGSSVADDLLWNGLRSAGVTAERQMTVRDLGTRYRVDFWITCAAGPLAVFLGPAAQRLPKSPRWPALQLSEEEVVADREQCVDRIVRMVAELGGLEHAAG